MAELKAKIERTDAEFKAHIQQLIQQLSARVERLEEVGSDFIVR
jgi:hypothetical protein